MQDFDYYTQTRRLINSYVYWDLFLHHNQYPYIGRCYAWAKRVGAVNILDMDKKEREELLSIVLPNWNESVNKSFHPSNINFAIFANTAPHLHAHFIPRYREVVKFSDIEFIDVNPDGNYAPYPKRKLAESVMESIKHELVRGF